MLQRLLENFWAFSFQVAHSTLYTVGYKPLDEAREKMHAGMAAEDPTTYEFSTHVDAQRKQIVANLATRVDGATTRPLRRDAMSGDGPG
jgi:hypothetical protein